MAESSRLFVSGTDVRGRSLIVRIELAGEEVCVVERRHVDPAAASGRGASPGVVAGLAQIGDCRGGQWLLATVERGRPRLIDPDGLGVVALLGRRREWRGAAEVRSPFLPVRCDRPPRIVGGQRFALSRTPAGAVDLLRICPGAPIERWYLGELGRRVELLAGESSLVLVAGDRLATIDLAELVPGGEPLTDPRDVELAPKWRSLPSAALVVGVLPRDSAVWTIEREGDRWFAATLELESMRRLKQWPISRPQRWLGNAETLWIANHASWTRIDADEGPGDRLIVPSPISGPCAVELRDEPRLWWWSHETSTLHRASGRLLAERSISSWTLDRATQLRRIEQLLIADMQPVGQRATLIHADELAELLALDPSLAEQWRTWFLAER